MLLCLGLDFRHGGFVDARSRRLRKSSSSIPATATRWSTCRSCTRSSTSGTRPRGSARRSPRSTARTRKEPDPRIPRERARPSALKRRRRATSASAVSARPSISTATAPAYLNLGDVIGAATWPAPSQRGSGWSSTVPERAYLAFERLERAYTDARRAAASSTCAERLIAANPQDWRARLALAPHLAQPRRARRRFDLLLEALAHNPHGLAVHQEIWEALSQLGSTGHSSQRYVDAHARRGLLPRPPRLHPLPLPQHRAALAVPALPRVEYLRRGADRAGEGYRCESAALLAVAEPARPNSARASRLARRSGERACRS